MKKNDLINNIIVVLFFLIIIFINWAKTEKTLEFAIIIQFLNGCIFILATFCRFKNIKNMFRSIEFIYGFCFWVYSIMGAFVYMIDKEVPRIYFFKISTDLVIKTLYIYIYTFSLYGIFCFLFNRIKYFDFDEKIKNMGTISTFSNKVIIIVDMIAILVTILNIFKIVMYGSSFFDLNVRDKRIILNNKFSHLINLFMLVYSLYVTLEIITTKNKKINILTKINLVIISFYWIVFLTCERRIFVTFFIGMFFIILYKFKKIKFKYIVLVGIIIFVFLFSAAFRDNITLKTHSLGDIIYSSTTEFYCTFMVSEAYVAYPQPIRYGDTYIVDTIQKLVPRFLYPSKRIDLADEFHQKFNTNVGFAFNPVAEGILNFGNVYAPIAASFLMFLITLFARKKINSNVLNYIILFTFALDFNRGAFSNFFFDYLFCSVIITLIYKCVLKEGK